MQILFNSGEGVKNRLKLTLMFACAALMAIKRGRVRLSLADGNANHDSFWIGDAGTVVIAEEGELIYVHKSPLQSEKSGSKEKPPARGAL